MCVRAHVIGGHFLAAVAALSLAAPARGQRPATTADAAPLQPAALAAVVATLAYDTAMPLDARVLGVARRAASTREKIVFTGWRGRVPGFLALPQGGARPLPVVLLSHPGGMSKDFWWQRGGGGALTDSLLASGFAVLALDAQGNGERTAGGDYLPLITLFSERRWLRRFRDLSAESAVDYRRALDYLATRPEIDMARVGILGYSMGGVIATLVAATDERIRAAVLCAAALPDSLVHPFRPIDVAPALARPSVLVLAGETDEVIPMADTRRFFAAVPSAAKRLISYPSGHELPPEYSFDALAWLREHLR